jgi:nucleoid-associated protein YgaU
MSHRATTLSRLIPAKALSELKARTDRNRELVAVFGLAVLILIALFTALAQDPSTPAAQAAPAPAGPARTAPAVPAPTVAGGPRPAPDSRPVPTGPPTPRQPAHRPGERAYRVRPGDTLASVALRHGVDYRRIAADNRLPDPNLIRPGQPLRIGQPTPGVRLIRPGDTLGGLSTATGLTVRELRALNPWITDPDRIPAGAGLRVRR